MEEEIPTSPPNPGDYEKEDDDLSPNMEGLKISEEFKHQGLALLESKFDVSELEKPTATVRQRKEDLEENQKILQAWRTRRWLKKHDKGAYIDFDDKQRDHLKKCFDSLDQEKSGKLGVEQLEEPLIGLLIAKSRDDVQELIDEVDNDGNHTIEFAEFLKVINPHKRNNKNQKSQAIYEFFSENVMNPTDNELPFDLKISQARRKNLLEAVTQKGNKDKAEEVIRIYEKHLGRLKAKKAYSDAGSI